MAGFIDRIRASHAFQRFMRVFQFLSAIVSLGLFSSRLYKVLQLTKRASDAYGAVEGILAAAVAYTILVGLMQLCIKKGAPKILRWLLIVLDLAFVVAFIVVAVLTRPNGGLSGLCRTTRMRTDPPLAQKPSCKLPLGTFVLAILSIFLHLLTAIFYEIRDRHRAKKDHSYSTEDGVSHRHRMSERGRK